MKKSNNKKIGWQKYEDFLEKQLSSPILTTIIQNVAAQHLDAIIDITDDEDGDLEVDDYKEDSKNLIKSSPMLPITQQLMDDVTMLSSFDCWIGHTNFDITHQIKNL